MEIDRLLKTYPNGLGGFARLFKDFDKEIADWSRDICDSKFATEKYKNSLKCAEITLIGHSMGTIVLNELLPQFPKLANKIDNIVYMASAARIRDSERTLIPLLERSIAREKKQNENGNGKKKKTKDGGLRFYNLMLHPLADAREPVAFTAAPSGSLLEWIDEMYEHPETVLDRTFGKWRNVRVAKHIFPKDVQDRMTFKVFATTRNPSTPAKRRPIKWETGPNPIKHGGFNDHDMRYWCPSFWGANRIKGICENGAPSQISGGTAASKLPSMASGPGN